MQLEAAHVQRQEQMKPNTAVLTNAPKMAKSKDRLKRTTEAKSAVQDRSKASTRP